MKSIFFTTLLLFLFRFANATLYIVVVGQNPPALTNVCPGDTIRFCGDSLNGFVYGTIAGILMNADSTLSEFFSVSSDTNVATHWDHVLVSGDLGYYFAIVPPESGIFSFNCTSGIFIEPETGSSVIMYPNPATNQVTISSHLSMQSIILYDVFGNKIVQLNPNSKKEILDISNYATGIYLVEIKINYESIFKKLVKN